MYKCTRLYLVRATAPTGLYLSFGNFLLLFQEYNLIASAMDIMMMLVLKMLVLKATCDLTFWYKISIDCIKICV